MKDYNILYLPIFAFGCICYGALLLTVGLLIGVREFDSIVMKIISYLKDKIYFQVLLFLANCFLYYLGWKYWGENFFYKLINQHN